MNRFGAAYYLHAGVTKLGRPRYFVRRTIAAGALAEMPADFEFAESLNGTVSVRRISVAAAAPADDVELVRTELARHVHLRNHAVEGRRGEILVHEPVGLSPSDLAAMARQLCLDPAVVRRRMQSGQRRYTPVMKFAREPAGTNWLAYRMTYRGHGGWHLFGAGPLRDLVRELRVLGTDEFFELF